MSRVGETLLFRVAGVNQDGPVPFTVRNAQEDPMSADDLPKFYSLASVAKATDYSVRSLREFIKKGELKVERWGRDYRVTDENFKAFVEARRAAEIPDAQRPGTSAPGRKRG